MCRYAGCTAVFEWSELDRTAASAVVVQVALFRQIAVGSRLCIHLDVDSATGRPSPSSRPHTIVLAAPSDGLGTQYTQAMHRCFSALAEFARMRRPFLVGGAGAIDLALWAHCKRRADDCRRTGEKHGIGWRIVASALLAVPRTLYDNACRGGEARAASRFLDVLHSIDHGTSTTAKNTALGLGQSLQPRAVCILFCALPLTSHPSRCSHTVQLPVSQCDVDGFERTLEGGRRTAALGSPPPPADRSLRLPALMSLTSSLDAGVAESPCSKHATVSSLLALLGSLLRIERCVAVSSIAPTTAGGRLMRTANSTARRGRGWVGAREKDGQADDNRSDSDDDR